MNFVGLGHGDLSECSAWKSKRETNRGGDLSFEHTEIRLVILRSIRPQQPVSILSFGRLFQRTHQNRSQAWAVLFYKDTLYVPRQSHESYKRQRKDCPKSRQHVPPHWFSQHLSGVKVIFQLKYPPFVVAA